jgi:hypothetical protein
MGLDMYFYKKSYVSNHEWTKPEHRIKVTIERNGKEVDSTNVRYIVEEAGYWRKANAIHKWFVDNVQNGKDNCEEYYVPFEKLQQLKKDCELALTSKVVAENILPTQSGFFFGSTDYDKDYEDDLKQTIEIVDKALADYDKEGSVYFYYRSSW